jgi:hypothetical protein
LIRQFGQADQENNIRDIMNKFLDELYSDFFSSLEKISDLASLESFEQTYFSRASGKFLCFLRGGRHYN